MRIIGFVLADEDVSAPGPVVETGANVSGYSGLPLFYGLNSGRCLGRSYCAPLGLGRRGSSRGLSLLVEARHTEGIFSKFTRRVSAESFL